MDFRILGLDLGKTSFHGAARFLPVLFVARFLAINDRLWSLVCN
jgi:hypothetical protein